MTLCRDLSEPAYGHTQNFIARAMFSVFHTSAYSLTRNDSAEAQYVQRISALLRHKFSHNPGDDG